MANGETCSIDDCDAPARTSGWCSAHYQRWLRHGSFEKRTKTPSPIARMCSIEGCGRKHRARGLCATHLKRQDRYGDPHAGRPVRAMLLGGPICTVDGCERESNRSLYCELHRNRLRVNGSPGEAAPRQAARGQRRWINSDGYVVISGENSSGSSQAGVLEHRAVMERALSRPLLRSEQVHHVNGVRSDNRPENLELWSTSQPSGQRVADKVRWARELLDLYGALFPAD
jgi:HNH endonuclease